MSVVEVPSQGLEKEGGDDDVRASQENSVKCTFSDMPVDSFKGNGFHTHAREHSRTHAREHNCDVLDAA